MFSTNTEIFVLDEKTGKFEIGDGGFSSIFMIYNYLMKPKERIDLTSSRFAQLIAEITGLKDYHDVSEYNIRDLLKKYKKRLSGNNGNLLNKIKSFFS